MRKPRPAVVSLTQAAATRVREIMHDRGPEVIGLRVGVRKGGCAGMEYTMDYATDVGPFDERIETEGVQVLIDPKAILFLIGTQIDYVTEKLSSKFVFRNPNETDACGCGESVTIVPQSDVVADA